MVWDAAFRYKTPMSSVRPRSRGNPGTTKRLLATFLAALVPVAAACGRTAERPACSDSGEIATVCGFANPEDLEYVPAARLVLVSNMRADGRKHRGGYISGLFPGTHSIVRLWPPAAGATAAPDPELGDEACPGPPDPGAYYPHGITSARREGRTFVYVVTHRGKAGGREAIDVFELTGVGIRARMEWKACIPTDGGVQSNDLAVAPDGTIVAANYQPDGSLLNTVLAATLGTTTGDVMTWRRGEGWHHLPGTESAMANGIALSADGEMLFYTETITGLLHRRPLRTNSGAISIEIGGNPDNLTWTRRGTLLVATHTAGPRFLLCSLGRQPCRTSWAVKEVDPDTLEVRPVLEHDGRLIGAVATALEVDGYIYLGSVFDDRIGVVPARGSS